VIGPSEWSICNVSPAAVSAPGRAWASGRFEGTRTIAAIDVSPPVLPPIVGYRLYDLSLQMPRMTLPPLMRKSRHKQRVCWSQATTNPIVSDHAGARHLTNLHSELE
jgi:hypothetical protein